MKIYFAGSIRGGREDKDLYAQIINLIKNYGEVLTEHIGNSNLTAHGEIKLSDTEIFDRDVTWVKDSDVIVAEVSTPSLGVGFELGLGDSLNKKIICLFRPQADKKLSAMVGGNKNFTIKEYQTLEDVRKILDETL